ncbi:MAG: hypothetical protein PHC35_01260 [Deltaproteobacteria bacterium]|jgi:hypothetical protein|nr:hypothetical protein [Deltaproteobacteria bacterium]
MNPLEVPPLYDEIFFMILKINMEIEIVKKKITSILSKRYIFRFYTEAATKMAQNMPNNNACYQDNWGPY